MERIINPKIENQREARRSAVIRDINNAKLERIIAPLISGAKLIPAIAVPFIGGYLGYNVDKYFGTRHYATTLFSAIGLYAAGKLTATPIDRCSGTDLSYFLNDLLNSSANQHLKKLRKELKTLEQPLDIELI